MLAFMISCPLVRLLVSLALVVLLLLLGVSGGAWSVVQIIIQLGQSYAAPAIQPL